MAKFRCNYTGNVFEFKIDHDIKTMREHPDYTEIKDEPKQSKKQKQVEEKHDTI